MSDETIKPEKIKDLPQMDIGHMLLFNSKESSMEGPVFYIKESEINIKRIIMEEKISMQFRCSSINGGYSTPIMLMVKLNNNDDLVYGQWFNKYNNTDRELIKEILFQDMINFCLINNCNDSRIKFKCKNIYKKSIWEYFKVTEKDRKWSQNMFESDIMAIASSLSSRAELFNM